MIEIPVQAEIFNFAITIELDGEIFLLDFKFNDRSELWTMNIYDTDSNPIVLGVILVTGVDFYKKHRATVGSPLGTFFVADIDGQNRNADFETFGKSVKLYYIPAEELA